MFGWASHLLLWRTEKSEDKHTLSHTSTPSRLDAITQRGFHTFTWASAVNAGAGFCFSFAVLLHLLLVLNGNSTESCDFGIARNVSVSHTLHVRNGNSGFYWALKVRRKRQYSTKFFTADWSCYEVGQRISLFMHLQSLTLPVTRALLLFQASHWHAWFISSFLQFWAVADSQFGYFPADVAQRPSRVIWFYGHIPKPVSSTNRICVHFKTAPAF